MQAAINFAWFVRFLCVFVRVCDDCYPSGVVWAYIQLTSSRIHQAGVDTWRELLNFVGAQILLSLCTDPPPSFLTHPSHNIARLYTVHVDF